MTLPPRPPAAWYLDPTDPSQERWWDGTAWTDFRRTPAVAAQKRRIPVLTWIVGGIVAFFALIALFTSGFGGFVAMFGLAALITGIYAVSTRRPTWLRLPHSRKIGAAVTAGAIALMIVGGGMSPDRAPTVEARATTAATATVSATPTPTPTATEPLDPATPSTPPVPASVAVTDSSSTSTLSAAALLETLAVKGKAPQTGYERADDFGDAWLDVDRNGCDTRNDMLARDLTSAVKSGACKVTSGTLVSPYTGTTIGFVRGDTTSPEVQIDHVVPLLNAWITGGQQLTLAQRISLANDPINLLAVDRSSNAQKSAGDAATWLPSNKAFRCDYVARQVSVKATYSLWVTTAEKAAISRVLADCPAQASFTSPFAPAPVLVQPTPEPVVAAEPEPAPEPDPVVVEAPAPDPVVAEPLPAEPAEPAAEEPTAITGINPGGFCSEVRAIGIADNGRSYHCGGKGADANGKYHWNAM